jgi:signal transduction histidine kinase
MRSTSQHIERGSYNLITSVATSGQSRLIIIFICALVGSAMLIMPVSYLKYPVNAALLVSASAVISLANLVTAYVLFMQFLYTRLLRIALLAATYLFSSLIVIPHVLTFPDALSDNGLLWAGLQSSIWPYVFWHAGFSIGIGLYVVFAKKWHDRLLSIRATRITSLLLLIAVPAFTILVTVLALWAPPLLPTLIIKDYFRLLITSGVGPVLCIINILACILVLFLLNDRLLLHGWLKVTVIASLLDVLLFLFGGSPFSLGWYASRVNSVIAAIAMLFAILYEINLLYGRLNQQSEELLKQQRVQDNFVAVVSHEFRTALTSIAGFSELMYLQKLSDEEIKEFSHDISIESAHLKRLINELLDLERMKTGDTILHLERIELNSLVAQVVQRIQPVFSSQNRELGLDLDMNLPPLWGDADKLALVITNLLSNAIKYSPKGSTIFVSSKQDGKMAHLLVRDQRIGISPEQLEHVFQPYSRVESLHTLYVDGTGLDLAIVRQIVEMHHGRVWVESQAGQGSIFHLTLPVANMLELIATRTSLNSRLDNLSML